MKSGKLVLLLMVGLTGGELGAVPCEFVLGSGVDENLVTLTYAILPFPEVSDEVRYSGNILSELEVNLAIDEVTEFEMTGGTVPATDAFFSFDFGFFGSQVIELKNGKATPISLLGAEVLDPAGSFTEAEHVFRFDEGQFESMGDFGTSSSEFSDDPFLANGVGMGELVLSNRVDLHSTITGELIQVGYQVSLSMDLASSNSEEIEGVTVTSQTSGVISASGSVAVPTSDFFEWVFMHSPEAGAAVALSADANGDGVADGLTWGLGFAPGHQHAAVLEFDEVAEKLELLLGPEGSRGEILLEMNDGLAAGGWVLIPSAWVSTGGNPLPSESAGLITVTPDLIGKRFFRARLLP